MPHSQRLITTRLRAAVVLVVTVFLFLLAVRDGLRPGRSPSPWLLPLGDVLHGWPLIAVNVAFYVYLAWMCIAFVRAMTRRERFVALGWLLMLLVSPLKHLRPDWQQEVSCFDAFALTIALLAALSLLRRPAPAEVNRRIDNSRENTPL
jgi:prepilin signal peptidase PulO-like enzyme (type II secretory pathway)